MLTIIFAIIFFCLCIQAAFTDTLTFKIPNWMNLSFLVLFVPAAFAANIGWETAGIHLLVAATALIISFGLFSFNIFGGGDAKMIPGVLLWIGPAGAVHFLFGMAIAGGLLTIFLLSARQMVPVEMAPGFARKIIGQKKDIPYGVAIAVGAFVAAGQSPLLIAFVQKFSGAS